MKITDFITDDRGKPSAARLNMMIGVLVGSFAVLWLTIRDNLSGDVFAAYLLATGGVYGVGKWRDSVERIEKTKAEGHRYSDQPARKKDRDQC